VGGLGSQKRVITLELEILGLASDDYQTTIPKAKLRQIAGHTDEEHELLIDMEYGSAPEVAFVRITDFTIPTRQGYGRRAQAFIEFTATDPRKYSPQLFRAVTGLPTPPRGNSYPIAYGVIPGDVTAANRGEVVVENQGNAPSPAVYTIVGPTPSPTVTITYPNGKRKRTTFNLPLAAGEVLVADTSTGIITVSGAVRSGKSTGALVQQLEIPPGKSVIALGGRGSTDTSMAVSWRDAIL
jgi:hypothetical protein